MADVSNPFARAVDLSGLKRPAPAGGGGLAGMRPGGAPAPGSGDAPAGAPASGTYVVEATEELFQDLIQQSMVAPVLLVAYSPSKMPASAQLADDLGVVVDELEGRYLLGRVDVDNQPAIAQAMQIQTLPMVMAVLQGRPQPLFQSTAPIEELRTALGQLAQSLAAQGVSGRHQPLGPGAAAPEGDGEPAVNPRYAPAEDALMAGDLDTAIAEYERLLADQPADAEASVGLARAKLLKRTSDADLDAARAAAAQAPDDIDAQLLVADLDLLGGHVDDAFARLIGLVKRTTDEDRDRVRLHLVDLFAVVGDDPRVLRARQALASALY